MLIGNYSVLQKTPNRLICGSASAVEWNARSNFNKSGMAQNRAFQDGLTSVLKTYGRPTGYYPPYTWVIPTVRGEISSINQINGASSIAADAALGLNATADLAGSGTITEATAQLVISMAASLIGSGDITASDLRAYLNATASLTGGGDLTSTIGALAWAVASLEGSGGASATPHGSGELTATITSYSDMTAEGVRDAVWNAILANYITAGSAGVALASASSAGDPWSTLLPGSYAAGTAGDIIGNLLDSIGARLVENGLSQDEVTRIMFSAIKGTTTGVGTTTETFASDDGAKTRITATYDAEGNRLTVATDGT